MIARHEFIPDVIWVRDDSGWLVPLSRSERPEKWMEICASDRPIITQVDDGIPEADGKGCRPTSSSSAPPVMAEMIGELDLRPGMKTLEIGTGTGYNVAVLADIVGAENVTTVELDKEIAERARTALRKTGYRVVSVIGDGASGYPPNAPYDRLIATVAVRVIPYAWIEQVRAGGRMVVPVSLTFRDTGALVTLTVQDDGGATGPFRGDLAFMLLRSQRPGEWEDIAGPYQETTTRLNPRELFNDDYEARFAIGALVPNCRQGRTFEFADEDGVPAVCLQDQQSRSWATFTPGAEKNRVRQHGPRNLWNELEAAYEWWTKSGRPQHERFGMTVTRNGQSIWLDSPERHVAPLTEWR